MWPVNVLFVVSLLGFLTSAGSAVYLKCFRTPPAGDVGALIGLATILGLATFWLAWIIAECNIKMRGRH